MSTYVKGVGRYIRRLNREMKAIEGRTLKGLIRAGIVVIRSMEKTPPLIPIDTGNLRASMFMVTSEGRSVPTTATAFSGTGLSQVRQQRQHSTTVKAAKAVAANNPAGPMVVLGFSAYYAAFVHENIGANFQRPGAGAKFFQAAIRRNEKEMLRIIAEEARIPK